MHANKRPLWNLRNGRFCTSLTPAWLSHTIRLVFQIMAFQSYSLTLQNKCTKKKKTTTTSFLPPDSIFLPKDEFCILWSCLGFFINAIQESRRNRKSHQIQSLCLKMLVPQKLAVVSYQHWPHFKQMRMACGFNRNKTDKSEWKSIIAQTKYLFLLESWWFRLETRIRTLDISSGGSFPVQAWVILDWLPW